jgi:putative transposase
LSRRDLDPNLAHHPLHARDFRCQKSLVCPPAFVALVGAGRTAILQSTMPRANRYVIEGHVYHLTARCHDGSFLLKFAMDRDEYRRRLRAELKGSFVWLLAYCITSNHVHMLVTARGLKYLSGFMQRQQGEFAEWYNFRARRRNQFWGGRYHATMIESGTHLWNCMTYIDLNMVRAGVVKHPREWKWSGYDELVGARARHTLLRMEKVIELTAGSDREQFARDYTAALDDAIDRGGLRREPHWTESIAVGSKEYVTAIREQIKGRRRTRTSETLDGAWEVHEPEATCGEVLPVEAAPPYGQIPDTKIERKQGVWVLNWA